MLIGGKNMSDFYSEIDDPDMVEIIAEQFYLYMQTRDEQVVSSDFLITSGQSAQEVAEQMVDVITNPEFPKYREISHDAGQGRMLNGFPFHLVS
jgi:hypothetical protein